MRTQFATRTDWRDREGKMMKNYKRDFVRAFRFSIFFMILLAIFWSIWETIGDVPAMKDLVIFRFSDGTFIERIPEGGFVIARIDFPISQWFTILTLPIYIFLFTVFCNNDKRGFTKFPFLYDWQFADKENNDDRFNVLGAWTFVGLVVSFTEGVLLGLVTTLALWLLTDVVILAYRLLEICFEAIVDWLSANSV